MTTTTNKAMAFTTVSSKEVISTSTKAKQAFPVQVKMTLAIGSKQQTVTFGYSRLGGRQTFMVVEGKAPVVMSRAEFVKRLMDKKIINMKQVNYHLGQLRTFSKDEFIVAKCECCSTGMVTAANVDYTQRNHAKLSEKLGRTVNAFSKICYACQGQIKVVSPKQEEKAPVIPAKAETCACESCGNKVSTKVAQYSVKKFGKVLCYKPCQTKATKANLSEQMKQAETQPAKEESQPATSPTTTPAPQETPNQDSLLTPALVAEIMALDVDAYSEIAKLQEQLAPMYKDDVMEQASIWNQVHEIHAANKAQDDNQDDICVVCDGDMPTVEKWNHDICPSCVLEEDNVIKDMTPESIKEEARVLLGRTSEASAVPMTTPVVEDEKAAAFMGAITSEFQDSDIPPMPEEEGVQF